MASKLVTPHQLDLWSSNLSHLYNALEGEMLRKLMDMLGTGNIGDIQAWQLEKMQMLHLYNNEVVELLSAVSPYAEEDIKKYFEDTIDSAVEIVDKAAPVDPKPLPTVLDDVMKGYLDQTWLDIDNNVNQTLITTNYGYGTGAQAYTEVLNKTAALFNTGLYNFEEALEKSVQDLAQKGIKSTFIDKGGHTWSIERYASTVLRSTLNNTYNKVKTDRMSEYGMHHVVVTSHMGARLACVRIQAEVVDLRPMSEIPEGSKYRSIYDPYWQALYGTAGGHRGANCTHQHIPFQPGVNVNNQPKFDREENAKVAKNKDRQRQIERNIVKYKKNAMVSKHLKTGKDEHWNNMVKKWEGEMEEHLSTNGEYLSRNHVRETVYTPLETLLNG